MCERITEVRDFLWKFKFFADHPSQFSFIEREKNMASIGELGMCISQAKSVILQLSPYDYVSGPLPDEKYPDQNLWVFGAIYNDEEIYIKLSDYFKCNVAKCLSFHKAEHPMIYPFREQGDC